MYSQILHTSFFHSLRNKLKNIIKSAIFHGRLSFRQLVILFRGIRYKKIYIVDTSCFTIEQVKQDACAVIKKAGLTIEYLEIVAPDTLENCLQWQKEQVCCVAAICGKVRLIDNMLCESVL